jgi:hypothetical protein
MNAGETACGSCGQSIEKESPNADPALRRPCPYCGSLTRAGALGIHSVLHATTTFELSVTSYPQTLLATAKDLLDRGQFGISIVVAHRACEVATERVLSKAFAAKSLQYLEEPVLDFLNGYNLANERNRKLYVALTGDAIQEQLFWPAFKASATRRNSVIHGGKSIRKAEAEESMSAASALVGHLGK